MKNSPYLAGTDTLSQKIGFFSYIPIVTMIFGSIYLIIPYDYSLIILPENFLLIFLSDYLHQQYHTKGSWLEPYPWFQYRRNLHFKHHKVFTQNLSLGGMDYTIDKYMGSFKDL